MGHAQQVKYWYTNICYILIFFILFELLCVHEKHFNSFILYNNIILPGMYNFTLTQKDKGS